MFPDFTFSYQPPTQFARRVDRTYRLAVDYGWDFEWEGGFHLLDSLLETFSISRAGAVAPLDWVSVG
jgi:hypothetical protein